MIITSVCDVPIILFCKTNRDKSSKTGEIDTFRRLRCRAAGAACLYNILFTIHIIIVLVQKANGRIRWEITLVGRLIFRIARSMMAVPAFSGTRISYSLPRSESHDCRLTNYNGFDGRGGWNTNCAQMRVCGCVTLCPGARQMRIFSGKTTVENAERRWRKGRKGKKNPVRFPSIKKKNHSAAAMVH